MPAARRRAHGRGVTLAGLMVVVAVLSILTTVAVEQWSFILRREKERELIDRGQRIQLALYYYQASNNGASPTKLEDLCKGPKRILSQVPVEPMTARFDQDGKLVEGTGQWALIHLGDDEHAPLPHHHKGGGGDAGDTGNDTDTGADQSSGGGSFGGAFGGTSGRNGTAGSNRSGTGSTPRNPFSGTPNSGIGATPNTVGIRGVRSPSEDTSISGFQNMPAETPYSEWRFEIVAGGYPGAGLTNPNAGFPNLPYPPGFAGLRVPGGPPYPHAGFGGTPTPQSPVPGGSGRPGFGGSGSFQGSSFAAPHR